MLDIKTFRDGSRLVITIDGLPEKSDADTVIGFLSGLTGNVTQTEPANVHPVDTAFLDGPFKGMTPKEAMMGKSLKERDAVCVQFAAMLEKAEGDIRAHILEVGRAYLKERFAACEPAEYVKKLSERQLLTLYMNYAPFMTAQCKESILAKFHVSTWNAFLFQEADMLRSGAEMLIQSFKE